MRKEAAEQGHVPAQCILGRCYLSGVGVFQNREEAFKWFCAAAENGHAGGQYFLGLCYAEGVGVRQSLSEAVSWLRKAAAQGHERAWNALRDMGY